MFAVVKKSFGVRMKCHRWRSKWQNEWVSKIERNTSEPFRLDLCDDFARFILYIHFCAFFFLSCMHLALRTTSRSRHKYRPEILSGKMVYCPLCPNIVHLYHSNINEYSSVACLLVVHTPTGTVKYDVLSFFTAKKIRNRKHVIKYGWLHLFGRKLADSNFCFAWEHRSNYCAPFLWIWFVNIA